MQNTSFLGNNATNDGGALHFSCSDFGNDLSKCSLNISDTIFKDNFAVHDGGAIKWNFYAPTYYKGTIFVNNTAKVYGNNTASVAKTLIQINNNNERVLSDSSRLEID